jgi:hypothetical protein
VRGWYAGAVTMSATFAGTLMVCCAVLWWGAAVDEVVTRAGRDFVRGCVR